MNRLLEVVRQPYGEPGTRLRESEIPNQEMVNLLISLNAFRVIEEPQEEPVPESEAVQAAETPVGEFASPAPTELSPVEPVGEAEQPAPAFPPVTEPQTAPTQRLPEDDAPVAEVENEQQPDAE